MAMPHFLRHEPDPMLLFFLSPVLAGMEAGKEPYVPQA